MDAPPSPLSARAHIPPSALARVPGMLLVAFLAWRTVAALGDLPFVLNASGVREGASWTLEQRIRQTLSETSDGAIRPAEAWDAYALLRDHVAPGEVVFTLLAPDKAGRRLAYAYACLLMPRVLLRASSPAELATLAAKAAASTKSALYAFATVPRIEAGWPSGAELVATSAQHELWRLPRRTP